MSISNAEWSSELPTEKGYYLFTGSIMPVPDNTYHYVSKLLEIRLVMDCGWILVAENEMDEVGLDCINYVLSTAQDTDLWHKLSFPPLDALPWTSQAPTKEGTYFFSGIIQERLIGDYVLEFFHFKGSLTACVRGGKPAHRAKVGDCKGLWCEVWAPPLPEKPVVDYDDIPF